MTDQPRIGEKLPPLRIAEFSAAHVRGYASVSNDDNPVHVDASVAAAAGLSGCPVQGMLVAGQFEALIRQWRRDAEIIRFSMRFMRPLLVGAPVTLGGRVASSDEDGLILRLVGSDEDSRPVCVGAATVRL
jgi:acyl dehydratase